MADLKTAEQLLKLNCVQIKSQGNVKAPITPNRCIVPQYAHEIVISGTSNYDGSLRKALDEWFWTRYSDDPTLASSHVYSTRVVDDVFILLMRSWEWTVRVLKDRQAFWDQFGDNDKLGVPELLYKANSHGFAVTMQRMFKSAGNAITNEAQSLRNLIDEVRRDMNADFAAQGQAIQSVTSGMQVLANSIETVQNQLTNQHLRTRCRLLTEEQCWTPVWSSSKPNC